MSPARLSSLLAMCLQAVQLNAAGSIHKAGGDYSRYQINRGLPHLSVFARHYLGGSGHQPVGETQYVEQGLFGANLTILLEGVAYLSWGAFGWREDFYLNGHLAWSRQGLGLPSAIRWHPDGHVGPRRTLSQPTGTEVPSENLEQFWTGWEANAPSPARVRFRLGSVFPIGGYTHWSDHAVPSGSTYLGPYSPEPDTLWYTYEAQVNLVD